MSRKVKIIGIITALVLVFAATMATTIAYFSDRDSLNNKFTVADNTIEITEDFNPPNELTQGDNVFGKAVKITNTGNVPCYVRAFFDFSDSAIKDKAYLSAEKKNTFDEEDPDWIAANDYYDNLPEGWVYIPLDDPNNTLLGGYCYYTKPIAPGEETPYLFRSVNVYFDKAEDVKDFEIIVTADSVQITDKGGVSFEEDGKGGWKAAWNEFIGRRDVENN